MTYVLQEDPPFLDDIALYIDDARSVCLTEGYDFDIGLLVDIGLDEVNQTVFGYPGVCNLHNSIGIT